MSEPLLPEDQGRNDDVDADHSSGSGKYMPPVLDSPAGNVNGEQVRAGDKPNEGGDTSSPDSRENFVDSESATHLPSSDHHPVPPLAPLCLNLSADLNTIESTELRTG